MGKPHPLEKSLLFIGALYAQENIFSEATKMLESSFGNILLQSQPHSWNYTDYYDKELGTPIYRSFVFFDRIMDPTLLIEAKITTNDIERIFSRNSKRQINLDPGYLTLAKAVLSSTKNYSHRIYLGRGIYGEVTLLFKKQRFIPLPYTYHDYRDEHYLNIFQEARRLFKNMIQKELLQS